MINSGENFTSVRAAAQNESQRKRAEERRARDLALADSAPYRQCRIVFAALYLVILITVGRAIKIVAKKNPDPLVRELAERYVAVPEMALHKVIEIRALEDLTVEGTGIDLGCGDGVIGEILIRRCKLASLEGVDVNDIPESVLLSQGYAAYHISDVQSLPMQDDEIDYAISVCVLEHIPNIDQAIKEVARVLRPGGVLAFTTPNNNFRDSANWVRLLKFFGLSDAAERAKSQRDLDALHYTYRNAGEWTEALSSAGFDNISIEPIFSVAQYSVYDLMNMPAQNLRFYIYPNLLNWTNKWVVLHKLTSNATAYIVAAVEQWKVANMETATHWEIKCRKA